MSLSLLFYDRFADAGNSGASTSLSCLAALACHRPVFFCFCLSFCPWVNKYLFILFNMGPFLREGSESPSAYHRYPWLMAGMPGRRCSRCVLPPLPLSHKGMEAASLILSKGFKYEVLSKEGFATVSFLSQSGLVFMVLPSLCAQSTAGKPWVACVHPVKALLPSCFTQSCLRLSSPWVRTHYLQVLSLEHVIPSEPPENHLFLLPFRYSECKLE